MSRYGTASNMKFGYFAVGIVGVPALAEAAMQNCLILHLIEGHGADALYGVPIANRDGAARVSDQPAIEAGADPGRLDVGADEAAEVGDHGGKGDVFGVQEFGRAGNYEVV